MIMQVSLAACNISLLHPRAFADLLNLVEVLDDHDHDHDFYFRSYLDLNAGGPLLQLAHLRPLPPLPQHVEPDGLAPLT